MRLAIAFQLLALLALSCRTASADLSSRVPATDDDPVAAARDWLNALMRHDLADRDDSLMRATAFPCRYDYGFDELSTHLFRTAGELWFDMLDWGTMSELRRNAEPLGSQLQRMTAADLRGEWKYRRPTVLALADDQHRFVWSKQGTAGHQRWRVNLALRRDGGRWKVDGVIFYLAAFVDK